MRAVKVTDSHRLAAQDADDPLLVDDTVLVRVAACGICGSDLHLMEGRLVPPGAVLGHEASGVVDAIGSAVTTVAVGDQVAIMPFDPCNECPACLSGASQRCVNNALTTIGLGYRPGAFAEAVAVSSQMAVPMPSATPVELGALAEPLGVALHGLRRSRLEPGMTVGVIGCGPIGLCAVAAAKTLGAGHVWACDVNEFRTALALEVGADAVGRSPRDADIVVECAGAKGTVDLAVSSAVGGGQVVLLAVNIKGDAVWPFVWVTKEVDILPCIGYTPSEYAEAVAWIAEGRANVAPMITKRVGLEEADETFFALLDGAAEGKVLVVP